MTEPCPELFFNSVSISCTSIEESLWEKGNLRLQFSFPLLCQVSVVDAMSESV